MSEQSEKNTRGQEIPASMIQQGNKRKQNKNAVKQSAILMTSSSYLSWRSIFTTRINTLEIICPFCYNKYIERMYDYAVGRKLHGS